MTNVIDAAREYARRRWRPIPLLPGEKRPALDRWQNLRLTEADLPRYFSDGQNLGLLLGGPSGGLVDVDLDSPLAVKIAPLVLPSTGMIHGRAGKHRSHHWYVAEPIPHSVKFVGIDGKAIVELRSTGGANGGPSQCASVRRAICVGIGR